ncbi:hypothetical protein [Fictibacillus gelatini]|uniref:hypothetical protein n=1 Tax=Fictibacillus gelatini TaxID=225985 RepID=UPI0004023F30|nr:hypothetical protein [Fictibacillus gelatini]
MEQRNIVHKFEDELDLRYKANRFIKQLNVMEALSMELAKFIQKETDNSEGSIIEAINQEVEYRSMYIKGYSDFYEKGMKEKAQTYTNHINDMNQQELTLYYDEVKTTIK